MPQLLGESELLPQDSAFLDDAKNVLNKPCGAICVRRGEVVNMISSSNASTNFNPTNKEDPKSYKYEDPSSLRVTFASRREKHDIQKFLCNKLTALIGDVDDVKYEENKHVVIQFTNDNAAKQAFEMLKSHKHITTVEALIEIDVKKMRAQYEDDIAYSLAQQDKRIEDLQAKHLKLKPKKEYVPIEEHERTSAESEVLIFKIEECKQHRKEFSTYTQKQLAHLSQTMSASLINVVEKNVLREHNRLSKAFPIYAKRSDIVATILKSNVTIIVGETGSGKSTQVVQYLYEAEMAETGVIVCTQPRKVAAMTLAKHVSREMHVNLGEELGYRVGMNEKCRNGTKIIYMTDHMLLNECIIDCNLSKYSCILIDEAHERSISTDMLLAFVKKCLPFRKDLKLVIMSATIEPELFVKYFTDSSACKQMCTVSVIRVSGRTFPVGIEYHPLNLTEPLSAAGNYVMNAVDVARTIHSKEPSGDILVFLTSAPEIERACKTLEYLQNEAVVLPLHGKLPPEEQQKIFDESNKRKIIFSTNVAETSVTIPGVKYVVDTGLAKEMHFDTKKNMDSLEVHVISKSSAEQRKGRAGRVSAGICYRLYTEEDFVSVMPDRTIPEILRIQLSQVVLKMLEFGVPNVLEFDFVEHPDCVALEAAIETLRSLGAIRDNQLTDVGKKMAVLPLQPQLSKVLLEGLNVGLGTEALISVALSSLAGQVFFRGGTDEMKEQSDRKKLMFCNPLGDQITSLSVYKCWQEKEKYEQKKWCLENYVNAKSMRVAEETIKELKYILKRCLKIDVNLNLESLQAAECYLGKLYFDAFINNLAVYLGHYRAGYMATNLPSGSSSFIIFPGSSLNQLGSSPKYVVYERTLKTSCQFLTQVMAVKQDWIDEAITMGKLAEDPAVQFAEHMLLPFHVALTGPQTLKELKVKQKELVQTVRLNSEQNSIPPVFDFTPEPRKWGVVRALAQKNCHDAVQVVVAGAVNEIQAKLKQETKEFGLTKEVDWTRVVIGAGGTVQQMIMPHQFCKVAAVCSNEEESPDKITSCLAKYGEVNKSEVIRRQPGYLRLSITFNTSTEAQQAIKEFRSSSVQLYPHKGQQFTLRLQWQRRVRAPHAHLSFDSMQHCDAAFSNFSPYGIIFEGCRIKVSRDKYHQSKLFIAGKTLCCCDETTLKEEIGRYITSNFSLKMGYKRYDDVDPYLTGDHQHPNVRPNEDNTAIQDSEHSSEGQSKASENEIEGFQQRIEGFIRHEISQYTKNGTFQVKFILPRQWDIHFKAYVTFDDPDEGYKVWYSDMTQKCTIDGKLFCVSPNLKCMLSFRQEIYNHIHANLEEARKDLLKRYPKLVYIKVIPPDKKVNNITRISLTAYDVKAFAIAQNTFHEAARPHVLPCNTTELQEYILSQPCQEHLQAIQKTTSTYLHRDLNAMAINIYGASTNQIAAKYILMEKAKNLFRDGACTTQIGLRGDGKPAGLMKHLVTRYGYDLSGLLEVEGVRKISLNPHLQSVSVLATESGHDAVKICIDEALQASQAIVRRNEGEYKFDCSACLTPVDDPNGVIRLECCGHAFHVECLEIQLQSGTLTIPVQCASEDCSETFLLRDFENLQKRLKMFRMPVLVSAALRNFMEKNRDFYKNCPTPDCKMIYTQTKTSRAYVCSSCLITTCSQCHEQYHAGISCEVYRASKNNDAELLKWMEEDPQNRKRCPKCKAPIEKNEGCFHVACICGAHICWRCLIYFKRDDQCYDHQPYCPALSPPPIQRTQLPPTPAPPTINPVGLQQNQAPGRLPPPHPPPDNPLRQNPPDNNPGTQGNNSSCTIL